MTYKKFRELSPVPPIRSMFLCDGLCYKISPYISILCIRYNIRPNTVTLLMIITGIIAGATLMLPYVWCKILSFVLYFIWYTFDLSDGEVARFTKTFSKGGKYLDWSAHLVAHPLFAVGMWYSFVCMGFDRMIITIVTFLFIISELLWRNFIALSSLFNIDIGEEVPTQKLEKKSWTRFLYEQFVYLPNELIIIPLFLGLSIIFDFVSFYWIYIYWAIFYSFVKIRVFVNFVKKIYLHVG